MAVGRVVGVRVTVAGGVGVGFEMRVGVGLGAASVKDATRVSIGPSGPFGCCDCACATCAGALASRRINAKLTHANTAMLARATIAAGF